MSLSYYNSSTNNLIPIAGSASSTLNEMRSTIDDVVYNQADAFDDTVAYKVGAIVVYNDVTYKCIADTTAGTLPINTTYWARASLGDIIANFKATEVYMGTAAGWNALSSEAKAEYSLVCFTDEGEAVIQASDVVYDQSNVEDELDDLESDVDTLFSNLTSSTKTEDDVTATKVHSNGDYFELDGVFVKATADIAIGDSLIDGTNYVSTNIGTELSSMKTSFQVGCNTIMSAVTAKGVTPTSNSPTDIATAIEGIETGPETECIYLYFKGAGIPYNGTQDGNIHCFSRRASNNFTETLETAFAWNMSFTSNNTKPEYSTNAININGYTYSGYFVGFEIQLTSNIKFIGFGLKSPSDDYCTYLYPELRITGEDGWDIDIIVTDSSTRYGYGYNISNITSGTYRDTGSSTNKFDQSYSSSFGYISNHPSFHVGYTNTGSNYINTWMFLIKKH